MIFYIISSACYRLSCGVLILVINWLMSSDQSAPTWLAWTVTLTFLPAIIVPLLWKGRAQLTGAKLTAFSLFAAALLSLLMFAINAPYMLLILNTAIWFCFFVMESSWEAWFTDICGSLPANKIKTYSSISMSCNQAALMLGPVLVAYPFRDSPHLALSLSAVLFLLCALAVMYMYSQSQSATSATHNSAAAPQAPQKIDIRGYELALLCIWPTLAIFNFMLPVQVRSWTGDMPEVGLLDAAMGLGMIVSSFIVAHAILERVFNQYKLNLLTVLAAVLLWQFSAAFVLKLISVFCLGLIFNYQRIILRSQLAQKYAAHTVGKIIAYANSVSFLIISLSLYLWYDNNQINWTIPFLYTALIAILCLPTFNRRAIS